MKQKNLILIAVAVGCGLAAAFLMTQINAKPKAQEANLVQVPVALKALSVNSPLPKENLDTVIEMKTFNPDVLPPNVVLSRDVLAGKRVMRMKQPGEFFLLADLSDKATVALPPGYNMTTLKVTQDQLVGGWAVPGTRVDILASVRGKNEKDEPRTHVFPMLQDVLIVAVGTSPVAGPNGVMESVANVSVAATEKQTEIYGHAEQMNARLQFALRNQGPKPDKPRRKGRVLVDAGRGRTAGRVPDGQVRPANEHRGRDPGADLRDRGNARPGRGPAGRDAADARGAQGPSSPP